MEQYKALLRDIQQHSRFKADRTGVGCYSIFGHQMRFNLRKGFPLLGLRKIYYPAIFNENLWFISGSTDDNMLVFRNRAYLEAKLRCVDTYEDPTVVERQILDCGLSYKWEYTKKNKPSIWDEWAYTTQATVEDWLSGYLMQHKELCSKEVCGVIDDWHKQLESGTMDQHYIQKFIKVLEFALRSTGLNYTLPERTIGPMYGSQWRGVTSGRDQLQEAIDILKKDPGNRRVCITAWDAQTNPKAGESSLESIENGRQALASCHAFFQFFAEPVVLEDVIDDPEYSGIFAFTAPEIARTYLEEMKLCGKVPSYRLSCQFYCRSQDVYLGTPFNVAGYALITEMMALETRMLVGDLIWLGGDVHLYKNHIDQAIELMDREDVPLPKLHIRNKGVGFFNHVASDFVIENYNPHEALGADVAI